MTDTMLTPTEIQTRLRQELQTQDRQVEVSVRPTSLGWLTLKVVTDIFKEESLAEREERIDNLLSPLALNLGQYPFADYHLLTFQEKAEQPAERIQLPLWSDILMSPEPENPASIENDASEHPLIVTFYSFKGGVGRSTALGIVATLLANQNRRVVMVDFDLEAPGISILFRPDIDKNNPEKYGVLDYIFQRYLTPEEAIPTIENCTHQVNLPDRGELFLIPVGEYNENYIHRLAELDRRTWQSFYKGKEINNPVKQLIDDIKKKLEPDVILIDSRPGFNDTGAIALLDLADTGIICFSPTDQSFEGLHWVLQAARRQSDYRGKPDLRFLLTPMPIAAEDQLDAWITKVEDWITDHWGLPDGVSVNELYYKIFYNPGIAVASSLVYLSRNYPDDYLPLVNALDASLPNLKNLASSTPTVKSSKKTLNELRFETARAQDLDAEKIPDIFQRTEDFTKFLSNKTWLIRGAKGTGKSLLFRLFVEKPEKAKELARFDVDLSNFNFIAGHGESRLNSSILSSGSLESYEQQVGEDNWAILWLNYALLQLCRTYPNVCSSIDDLDPELVSLSEENNLTQNLIVSWLVERAKSPQTAPQATDELRNIDRWLAKENKRVWLFYDELDAGFGFGAGAYARRRRALESLLAWWLESGSNLKCISPKIFLREDIWNQLNFTNKGHYTPTIALQLRWDEADLWRLVLRQTLKSSSSFQQSLERELGITVDRLESVGLEQLRKSLYPLWGERMGRTKKAYTYNWVRTRIADSNNNCFPRSLILLLEQAVRNEKDFETEYSPDIILRPKSLIEALPYVSEQRVDEVRDEYPELEEQLNKLQGERSPIDEHKLAERWIIPSSDLAAKVTEMVDAGILKERSRAKDAPPRIYAVAELYLSGLGMVRKGQR
jgi:cellulose biosynthesis protein BcsQ